MRRNSKRMEAFRFIKAEIERTGRFPADRAICKAMSWSARTSTADAISALVRYGLLARVPRKGKYARGFVLTAEGKQWTDT